MDSSTAIMRCSNGVVLYYKVIIITLIRGIDNIVYPVSTPGTVWKQIQEITYHTIIVS